MSWRSRRAKPGAPVAPLLRAPSFRDLYWTQVVYSIRFVLLSIAVGSGYMAYVAAPRQAFFESARVLTPFCTLVAVVAVVGWFSCSRLQEWSSRNQPPPRHEPRSGESESAREPEEFRLVVRSVRRGNPKGRKLSGSQIITVGEAGITWGNHSLAALRWREVSALDWLLTGIELRHRDDVLFLETTTLPLVFGPLCHYPPLAHRVAMMAPQMISFHQRIVRTMQRWRSVPRSSSVASSIPSDEQRVLPGGYSRVS